MTQTTTMTRVLNRGLGNFQITEDDLIHNMIQRERKRLEDTHSNIFNYKEIGSIEIIRKIYKQEGHFRKYYESRSKAYCSKESVSNGNIPTLLQQPKIFTGLYTILFLILFYLTGSEINTVHQTTNHLIVDLVFVSIGWIVFFASAITAYKHAWRDLKLVDKFYAYIDECNNNIDESLQKFCRKLEVNHRFYLDNLIEEMGFQKKDYQNQFDAVENDLKNSARGPRDAINVELTKLYSQLRNTDKMKGSYSDNDIQAVRNQLQAKIDELRKSTEQFKVLENEIMEKRKLVKSGLEMIEETKLALIAHREETKDLNEYMEGIQESIGDEALDWGIIEKSRYERDLVRILNNLTDMEDSMQQLTSTVTRAANLLPTNNAHLAIAA